ncbi:MAG: DGQHR domain-containing protein [Burkholderiales bacterium]|nr:MAG: DGQHR domain-containing protein [Burkholderiales bacterium]
MPTYFYVIALTTCQLESRLRSAGEIVGRHSSKIDADLKRSRLQQKLRDAFYRDALWVISSSEAVKVGETSDSLLKAALANQRHRHCVEAMIEVLAEEGGTGGPHSQAFISSMLMRHQLSLDQLRTEFAEDANRELERRGAQRQAVAEQRARTVAVQAEVKRDLNAITYSFPAVRGIQAGREYFAAQIPYAVVAKLFVFDEDVVPPEHRAQRLLNERRAKAIADYMVDNPGDYVLPALTCSVSAEMSFEAIGGSHQVGMLHIPMSATLLINDGQHRRHAIGAALSRNPAFANETISVSIYYDQGLQRAQQMFADINSKQVRPSSAINALYDQRNPFNTWVLALLAKMPDIQARIDFENASVAGKSTKLWSLVAFKKFVSILTGIGEANFSQADPAQLQRLELAIAEFFAQLRTYVPDWASMVDGKIAPADVRAQLVIGQAVWLHGLALMGHQVMQRHRAVKGLERLALVSPSRSSPMWEGRCVVLGKMQMTADGIKATAGKLLQLINMPLPSDIAQVEKRLTPARIAAAA